MALGAHEGRQNSLILGPLTVTTSAQSSLQCRVVVLTGQGSGCGPLGAAVQLTMISTRKSHLYR